MLNAHLRFGWLQFAKITEKKTTSFRVRLDRLIAEPPKGRFHDANAHLISVIGGDTQIAAISAALSEGHEFAVEGPDTESIRISFGPKKPRTYRGSIQLPERPRPVRHLIAVSEDLAAGTGAGALVLAASHPEFVWSSVAKILGLPGVPEWAAWFNEQLIWRKAITSLIGIGCAPIRIRGTREEFLSWLGDGVRSGALPLPMGNRSVHWPRFRLEAVLQSPVAESTAPIN